MALDSFLSNFWNSKENYFNAVYPSNGKITQYWTFAQAYDAVLDGVERTHKKKYVEWIDRLYAVQDAKGWFPTQLFDDENWMALDLIRAYDLTGDKKYLEKAQTIFSDIMTQGWDTTCCGSSPGGIWWDKKHTQKATASNAGPVITAARLYQKTKDKKYLDFAKQEYAYWFQTMVNPITYQVADHINSDGAITWWKFTYNEGLMIGAGAELYKTTKEKKYLEDAHHIAGFMIHNEITPTIYGNVLFDGTNQSCEGDCNQFKGIGFRYLMLLYQQDTRHKEYYDVLKSSANAIWNLARDTSSNTFAIDWEGPPTTESSLAQNSSAVMALNLFVKLSE